MLNGIRIVEIEGLGPGPFAGMMLADLGAEVIVLHRPRQVTPVAGKANLLDRGKKSVTVDLKDKADLALAQALIGTADALIEGFRPGVMERLGLGPDPCMKANPKLVYGRMTGWGQDGPKSAMAGHDLNYIATSGALWYASEPGTPPQTPATLLGDIGGGALYLVAGILAGLLNASRSGKGTVVDAAIVDGSAHMMALLMSMRPTGNLAKERGQSLLDGPHWSRSYRCADGGHITVQCLEPKFYREFLEILGLDGDPDLSEQHDAASWPAQTKRLASVFEQHSTSHWAALLDGSDACVAPVLAPEDAANDAHMAARKVWRQDDGLMQPAAAPRFDGQVPDPGRVPARGEHSTEIRSQLQERGLIG